MTGGVDDHIDATSVGDVSHEGSGIIVSAARNDGIGGAELGRKRDAWLERVDGDHPRCAEQARLGHVHDPHRADADDGDSVAQTKPSGSWHFGCEVEAVCDGEQLGKHGHVRREAVWHLEHWCARAQVEVFGPSAEQMRRLGTCERVAVVLQVPTEVVRVVPLAEITLAASPVGRGDDTVTDPERTAIECRRAAVTDRRHQADVLVALDDRERRRRGVVGAGVLLGLTSERVLVGAADPRCEHLDQDRPGFKPLGIREVSEFEFPRCHECGCQYVRRHRQIVCRG